MMSDERRRVQLSLEREEKVRKARLVLQAEQERLRVLADAREVIEQYEREEAERLAR